MMAVPCQLCNLHYIQQFSSSLFHTLDNRVPLLNVLSCDKFIFGDPKLSFVCGFLYIYKKLFLGLIVKVVSLVTPSYLRFFFLHLYYSKYFFFLFLFGLIFFSIFE